MGLAIFLVYKWGNLLLQCENKDDNMRREIKDLLKKLRIQDEFIIGNGARHSLSVIHFYINRKSTRLDGKQFAIQFEKESQTIALWDLRKRLALSASLDLNVTPNITWNSVSKIYCYDVAIGKRNAENVSKVVIMPFHQFESFLRFNKEFGFSFDVDNNAFEEFEDDDYESIIIRGAKSEGQVIEYYGKRYERNSALRHAAIMIQGYKCRVCGFDFEDFYGDIGHEYIEVHHIKPLSEGEQNPDPAYDLIVVCSNCHKMIHRNKKSTLTPDELKRRIRDK